MKNKRIIPFSPPDISKMEIREVIKTLKSGWITTGKKTKLFEKKIAEYIGVSKAVVLNSWTAAAELALFILGVGPGDEVITSSYTYTASASIVHHLGAKIVLVDTAENSYEMDYKKLENAITEKTKVIIPVDIAGVICDYDKIYEIVNRKKNLFQSSNKMQKSIGRIIILSDAAHSFGAKRNGLISGQLADITCFSFHAVKNLTTSEGGAVVWKETFGLTDQELYNKFMYYSLHGQTKDALTKLNKSSWEYDVIYPAFKCNMTDVHASIGIAQIDRYKKLLRKRSKIIKTYKKYLDEKNIVLLEHEGTNFKSSGHLLICNINNITLSQRNEIINRMYNHGISTNVHYKPLPLLTAYKNLGFNIQNFQNSYKNYITEITLPLYPSLSIKDAKFVSTTLNKIIKEIKIKNV